jgi:hypothetical protein
MPYNIKKNKNKNCYRVTNKSTHKIHAKCTTKSNATRQVKFLQGIKHGWTPPKFQAKKQYKGVRPKI